MDGTLIVVGDGARTIPKLEMSCTDHGIPKPLGDVKPVGWWLAGGCLFGGNAEVAEGEHANEPVRCELEGTAALAVVDGRLIGIVSTDSPQDPTIWFSWPLDVLKVSSGGSRGVFKKRPGAILVERAGGADNDGDSLALKAVARYWANSERAQPWQESSLLEALRGEAC